jgi:hypothetical protein
MSKYRFSVDYGLCVRYMCASFYVVVRWCHDDISSIFLITYVYVSIILFLAYIPYFDKIKVVMCLNIPSPIRF